MSICIYAEKIKSKYRISNCDRNAIHTPCNRTFLNIKTKNTKQKLQDTYSNQVLLQRVPVTWIFHPNIIPIVCLQNQTTISHSSSFLPLFISSHFQKQPHHDNKPVQIHIKGICSYEG